MKWEGNRYEKAARENTETAPGPKKYRSAVRERRFDEVTRCPRPQVSMDRLRVRKPESEVDTRTGDE